MGLSKNHEKPWRGHTMYQLINEILLEFMPVFKRLKTWRWFVVVIIGFIVRTNQRGITSIISALRLKPKLYHCILHFFRSKGYIAADIFKTWIRAAMKRSNVVRLGGRVLTIGDHIKIPKEGRRMPGIQLIHQESQNSGKSEFIEGHIYGHVSAVITNGKESRSLPLMTNLHKIPPKDEVTKKPLEDTIVVQMIHSIHETAKAIKEPVVSVLDGFFCKGSTFTTAKACVSERGEKMLEIITLANVDTSGYTIPVSSGKKKAGRPKIYGDKVKLYNLFSDMSKFNETTLVLYGKLTKVKYLMLDLIWRPAKNVIRFVAVDSHLGQIVLMSDSLTLTAEDIITGYAFRYKIEPCFNDLKNTIGGFGYHFWTKALPKRKRWAKNSHDAHQEPLNQKTLNAKTATEAFVCLSTIAAGILTIIAFSHSREIWSRYPGWIRTQRSCIPSISIARETLVHDFPFVLKQAGHFTGFNFIKFLLRPSAFFYAQSDDSTG